MNARWKMLLGTAALAVVFSLGGCGSDGSDGAAGAAGATGPAGPAGADGQGLDPITMAKAEACATCHGDVGEMKHQATYDKYTDASDLVMTFTNVSSVPGAVAGEFDVTLTFTVTKDGAPYSFPFGAAGTTKTFYGVTYDSATRQYLNSKSMSGTPVEGPTGTFTLTQTGFTYAPEASNAQVYGYIADTPLDLGNEIPAGSHVALYDNVSNTAIAFGTAQVTDGAAYVSAANVSACETCHGTPYMKHGYRAAVVAGLPDFAACKDCHYDDRSGHATAWQYMVDEPFNWASGVAETADYSYTANIMNDVHMSHAMEFPYPQSMANCATCHAGKLGMVLADDKFTMTTCKSCHPVTGIDAWPGQKYAEAGRAPAMSYIWDKYGVDFHNANMNCQDCHNGDPAYPTFAELHTGYDARITDAATGTRYADTYTATIDSVSVANNVVTVDFSVSDADMVPYVYVSFYGWDSKNMIVASHSRDANSVRMEAKPDDANALFAFTPAALGATSYTAVLDLAAYAPVETDDIPTLIANGVIKTGMVTIAPRYTTAAGVNVGLDAVFENFDVSDGSPVADYFTGANETVDTANCEVCHDKLAVTFHGGSGRSNVETCRNCHVTTSGGSHLEMQSRGIDSYVHAIHSFQAFDPGDIDFTDPVEAARYAQHVEHTFPNFTIKNCEACHMEGTFNVPDQSKSMPGLLSGSDVVAGRGLEVPPYVTGPASRACGGCHRADLINEGKYSELTAFNSHTEMGGTLVDATDDDGTILYGIIDKIMSYFQ